MPSRSRLSPLILLAGAGLLSACVAPPPPIVLRPPPVAVRHPAPARPKEASRDRRCEQPPHPTLTDAEKTRLFDAFDGWQGERRPPGAAADAPLPPPAPTRSRAAAPGCRVSRD